MLVGLAGAFSLSTAQAMPIQFEPNGKSAVVLVAEHAREVTAENVPGLGEVKVSRNEKTPQGSRLSLQPDDLWTLNEKIHIVSAFLDGTKIDTSEPLIVEIDLGITKNSSPAHIKAMIADLEKLRKHPDAKNVLFVAYGEGVAKNYPIFTKDIPAEFIKAKKVRLGVPEDLQAGYINVPVQALGKNDVTSFELLGRLAIQAGRIDLAYPPQSFLAAYSTLAQRLMYTWNLYPVLSGRSTKREDMDSIIIKPIFQNIAERARLADLRRRIVEQAA